MKIATRYFTTITTFTSQLRIETLLKLQSPSRSDCNVAYVGQSIISNSIITNSTTQNVEATETAAMNCATKKYQKPIYSDQPPSYEHPPSYEESQNIKKYSKFNSVVQKIKNHIKK